MKLTSSFVSSLALLSALSLGGGTAFAASGSMDASAATDTEAKGRIHLPSMKAKPVPRTIVIGAHSKAGAEGHAAVEARKSGLLKPDSHVTGQADAGATADQSVSSGTGSTRLSSSLGTNTSVGTVGSLGSSTGSAIIDVGTSGSLTLLH